MPVNWRMKSKFNHFSCLDRLDSAAVSIFVVILVKLTNPVFVNSTNITTNIETAALSNPTTPNEYGQVHAELYSWAFLPCLKRRSTNMNIVQNKTKPVPSWEQVENMEKENYLVRYNSKVQYNSFCFSICNLGLWYFDLIYYKQQDAPLKKFLCCPLPNPSKILFQIQVRSPRSKCVL